MALDLLVRSIGAQPNVITFAVQSVGHARAGLVDATRLADLIISIACEIVILALEA